MLVRRNPDPDEDEFDEVPDDIDEGDTSRNTPTNEGIIDVLKIAYRANGLSYDLIESLPVFTFRRRLNLSQTQCVICLEEFERKDKLMRISCDHIYHADCMKK